jgi:hypothetical protein
MERIVLVINAHKPDLASIEFASRTAAMSHTMLTGLFIENLYSEYTPVDPLNGFVFASYVKKEGEVAIIKADFEQAICLFKTECLLKGVKADIIIERGDPLRQVIEESRFADFIIIDPATSFLEKEEKLPSSFVKEVLAHTECPVLLTPEKFDEVEEIIFCYDGSASSVFAIKQFTYLLPQYKTKNATLLEVNESGRAEFNVQHRKMMEWLKLHYHAAYYQALKGHVRDELFTHLFLKTNKMVVIGAYGRSLLSNFFKRSHAEVLIRMVDLPLFIAHV